MPHIVQNTTIKLDNSIELDSMFCWWIPDFEKSVRNKLLFDLKFYKNYAAFVNNYGRIYPLLTDNDKNKLIIPPLTIGIVASDLDMNKQTFAGYVSDYLEEIYGYWNVIDLDYQSIVNIDSISEDSENVFTLTSNTNIDNIYIEEISETSINESHIIIKTKEVNPNDEVIISEFDIGPNSTIDKAVINTGSFAENKQLQIICDSELITGENTNWNNNIINLKFKTSTK